MPGLTSWYRGLMEKHEIRSEVVQRLVFVDLAELELLTALKIRGESWENLLRERDASPHREFPLKNFLLATGRDPIMHPTVRGDLDALADSWSRQLFGKPHQRS